MHRGLSCTQSSEYEEAKALKNPRYQDRAESRRQTVGSDGTFQRDDAPASVHVYACLFSLMTASVAQDLRQWEFTHFVLFFVNVWLPKGDQ